MTPDLETVYQPEFKEKTGSLTFFGVLQILIGALFLLSFLFSLFGLMVASSLGQTQQVQLTRGTMIMSLAFYLALSVIFIWLGVGNINKRRWARALSLISSCFWFIFGLLTVILLMFILPNSMNQMAQSDAGNPALTSLVFIILMGFFSILLVVIPGVFVLFFKNKNVKLTVEKYDPKLRWTDKSPLPVIGMSLIFIYSSLLTISMSVYNWATPFFGILISGYPGAAIWIINTVVCIYIAVRLYRLNLNAWWLAVGYYTFWILSALLTFLTNDIFDLYNKMGIPAETLRSSVPPDLLTNTNLILMVAVSSCIMFGYLLYIKRYFTTAPEQV